MLTKEDLQAIAAIMDEKMTASEQRILTYIENKVERDIKIIAEGHSLLNEKLDLILERTIAAEELEPRVSALEYAIKQR